MYTAARPGGATYRNPPGPIDPHKGPGYAPLGHPNGRSLTTAAAVDEEEDEEEEEGRSSAAARSVSSLRTLAMPSAERASASESAKDVGGTRGGAAAVVVCALACGG